MLREDLSKFLYCIDDREKQTLYNRLSFEQVFTFSLDGRKIFDMKTFYQETISVLPFEPPFYGNSLDAFIDSLWEGLDSCEALRFAIIWDGVDNIVKSSFLDFLTIILAFDNVRRDLIDPSTGISSPKQLSLFLLGKGKSFKFLSEILHRY